MQTSKRVKLKAKSWIGAFGSNAMRAVGNRVNTGFNTPWFNPQASIVFTLCWAAMWFSQVLEMGRLHTLYTKTGKLVD